MNDFKIRTYRQIPLLPCFLFICCCHFPLLSFSSGIFFLRLASTLLKGAVAALRAYHSETRAIVRCYTQQRTLEFIQSNPLTLQMKKPMKKLRLREVKWLVNGNTSGPRISSASAIRLCSAIFLDMLPLLYVTHRKESKISLILGLHPSQITSINFWAVKECLYAWFRQALKFAVTKDVQNMKHFCLEPLGPGKASWAGLILGLVLIWPLSEAMESSTKKEFVHQL